MRAVTILTTIFVLLTAILFMACSTNTVQTTQTPTTPYAPTADATAPASPPLDQQTTQPAAEQTPTTPTTADVPPTPQIHEISMSAFQFGFDPSTITVKKGELVRITLTSKDVEHGISIPDLKVFSKGATPGKPVVIEFTPTKVGTFEFKCDVMCGSGHRDMIGSITVTE